MVFWLLVATVASVRHYPKVSADFRSLCEAALRAVPAFASVVCIIALVLLAAAVFIQTPGKGKQ
jgi:hypothetical protein